MFKVDEIISQGENSFVEFKNQDVKAESLAREFVAFSNQLGGVILVGVEDNGSISGINKKKYRRMDNEYCKK